MKPFRFAIAATLTLTAGVLVARPMMVMPDDVVHGADRQALIDPSAVAAAWTAAQENLITSDRRDWDRLADNLDANERVLVIRLLEEAEYMGSRTLPPSSRVTLTPYEVARVQQLAERLSSKQKTLLRKAVRGAFDHGGLLRLPSAVPPQVWHEQRAKPRPMVTSPAPTPQPAVMAR